MNSTADVENHGIYTLFFDEEGHKKKLTMKTIEELDRILATCSPGILNHFTEKQQLDWIWAAMKIYLAEAEVYTSPFILDSELEDEVRKANDIYYCAIAGMFPSLTELN